VRADIVSVGSFVPVGIHGRYWREVHDHHRGESSLLSAIEAFIQIHAPWPSCRGQADDVLACIPRGLDGVKQGLLFRLEFVPIRLLQIG